MKQRKEINIFSVSFLDLLSGALGAVLILFIIIPKLTEEHQPQPDPQSVQTNETSDKTSEKIGEIEAMLAVAIIWTENVDVDLHVKNTDTGNVCYFGQKSTNFGNLLEDIMSRSPGDGVYEIFFQRQVITGRYEININLYSGGSATVNGYAVIFPGAANEQKINFSQISLTREGETIKIGILNVTNNSINLEQ